MVAFLWLSVCLCVYGWEGRGVHIHASFVFSLLALKFRLLALLAS